MTQRIAAWALFLVAVAQSLNLWPLPQDAAGREIALWSKLKADFEGTDPSKSETPESIAEAKAKGLSLVNEALANTDSILYRARLHWGLWLCSILVSLGAATLALRRSRHWRWLTLFSLASFLGLQQPWYMFSLFFLGGSFDLSRGIRQLAFIGRDYPAALATMLTLNLVAPALLLAVAGYAVTQMTSRTANAL
jgi:hypothetical protein